MGEFTIQCTLCEGSYGTEEEYNAHGCSGEDTKFPLKIKLETQLDDEDREMEEALLSLASSAGELDLENSCIKSEPVEVEDISQRKEKELDVEAEVTEDPLSFSGDFDVSDSADHLVPKKSDSQEVFNETETFIERYTMGLDQSDTEMPSETTTKPKLRRKDYSCSCKICNSMFLKKEEFTKHFREEHKTYRYRPYECGICGKKFLHKHYVNLHMRVHTGEKPYICKLCPRSYSHKTSFTIHMRIHNGDRPYACGVCGKKCYDKSGLTSHMRSHTKETPYQCEVCGRRFTHSKSLLVHRRNHTGEKPYVCSYCGKAFRHWHKHKIHVRLHTGERPYKCKICGKGFPRNDEVSRHMRSHQGIKSFKCSICGVYCATQASITGHINLHHANLKTSEMDPPPEKTLVKNSTSGILGTKVPEPRSHYRVKRLGFHSNPSTSKGSRVAVGCQNDGDRLATRIIEVTSKDTPISIPSGAKKNHSRKLNCILPKSKSCVADSKEDNSTMSYQEFLDWQERMLTNQGLVVKGYSSSKENETREGSKNDQTSLKSTAVPTKPKETKAIGAGYQKSLQTATGAKPQYLLLSQGGDGNTTKILLPINMVGQSVAARNPATPSIGLSSAIPGAGVASQPSMQSQQQSRPILLVSPNVSNQPLLLVSNGTQKMLLVSPQTMGRAGIPGSQTLTATQDGSPTKLALKQEPKDPEDIVTTANFGSGVTIKSECPSPTNSSLIPDLSQVRIKEEPLEQEV